MILIKIALWLIAFAFVYNFLTSDYVNPYRLICVIGSKGSGKSTYLCKQALNGLKRGKKVYSTMRLPGTIPIDKDDIGKVSFSPGSIVLIDEAGVLFDCRDYKSFTPAQRDFFIYQRQNKLTVYLVSQTVNVDKKIVQLTDRLYIQKNFARIFSVTRRVNKQLTIGHAGEDGNGTLIEDYKLAPILFGGIEFTYIPRYIEYFQSFDPPELQELKREADQLTDLQYKLLNNTRWKFYYLNFIIRKYIKKGKSLWQNIKSRINSRRS